MIIHEYLMQIRQDEILAEAERSRLINEAKSHPVNRFSFYARSLAWLGSILFNLGSLLEKRFGKEGTINHSQSIDRSLEV